MALLFEITEVTFLWMDGPENTKQKRAEKPQIIYHNIYSLSFMI